MTNTLEKTVSDKEPIRYSSFSQIPTKVTLDINITDTAKILLGLISSLTNEKGYCWASNSYLGKKLGKSDRTISRSISLLKKKGYISADYSSDDSETRKIMINYAFINSGHIAERPDKSDHPPRHECLPLNDKNDHPPRHECLPLNDKNDHPPRHECLPPSDKNDHSPTTKMTTNIDNQKQINERDKMKSSGGKNPPQYPDFAKSEKAKASYEILDSMLTTFSNISGTQKIRPSKRFFGYFCGALGREGKERLQRAFIGYAQSKDHRMEKYNWNLTALLCDPSKIAMWATRVQTGQPSALSGSPKTQEERRKIWRSRLGE